MCYPLNYSKWLIIYIHTSINFFFNHGTYIFIHVISSADCGSLSPPDNGFVEFSSGTEYKNFIVFECESMHEKSGPPAVVCRADGTWSSQVPTCTLQGEAIIKKDMIFHV